jgi:hypothetical protein
LDAFRIHGLPGLVQPQRKRRSTPAQRRQWIKAEIRQSVEDIAVNLEAHYPGFTFPRSTRREIEQLLHLLRLRDLGMSAGEIVMAMERL